MSKHRSSRKLTGLFYSLVRALPLAFLMLATVQLAFGTRAALALLELSAAKTDSLKTDADSSGGVTPGDTLQYTVVVTNGSAASTAAQYSDTIDSHTTLTSGSVRTTPIARNDSGYSTVGNVQLTVAAPGALANDNDPDGQPSLAAVAGAILSANGGNVNLAANGSFTYNPPAGFSGADTFTYTVQDADSNTDTATVSITVGQVVWFINNAVAGPGDGRFTSPFNSVANFNSLAADDPGDYIFVYQGSGAYTGTFTLLNNQRLIGNGAGLTISPNLSVAAGTRPTIANVALGSGNTVQGLNINTSTGTALSGANVGTLLVSGANVTNSGGGAVSLANGALTVNLDNVSSNGGANGVSLSGVTGSFAMNGGTIQNSTSHGVNVSNSTGTMSSLSILNSTINAAGGNGINLDVPFGGSAAFTQVTITSNTIQNSATGAGLRANIQGTGSIGKIDVGSNTFSGNDVGIDLATNGTANVRYDIHNNPTLNGTRTQVNIAANDITPNNGVGPTMEGYIRNNTITASPAGNAYIAVWVVSDGDGNITTNISNNTINNFGDSGIDVESRGGTGDVHATILGNSATTTATFPLAGLFLRSGNGTPGETSLLCVNVTSNNMNGGAGAVADYYLDRFNPATTVFQIQGLSPSPATPAQAETFVISTDSAPPATAFAEVGSYTAATCATVSFAAEPTQNKLAQQAAPAFSAAGLARTAFQSIASAWTTLREDASQIAAGLAANLSVRTAYASGETVNVTLGDLDAGQQVTITFDVTVDAPTQASDLTDKVCNQGTVSGSNFTSALTDDPDTGTAGDTTCTSLQTGTIIIAKDQVPDGSASFGFTSSITDNTAFNVTGDSNTTINNVPAGSYTVTEDDPASISFKLTALSCNDSASSVASTTDLGARTATVNLEPNETVTCTYTDNQLPSATTDAASGVTANSATLNGTVNANNNSATVTFEYGLDTSYGTTVTADQSPVTGSTDTAVSKAITGLTPNTIYHYRVIAQNSIGAANGSDQTFTTGTLAPSATTNAATVIIANGATLNGTVNANNASTTVTFEYGLDTNYGSTVTADQSPVTGTTDTSVSKTLSGLLPNTTYHYRVVGQSAGGTTPGADMTFTTSAVPSTVTTDAASGVGTTAATLNGTVNANNASTTVTFEYGLDTNYGSTVTADQSPVTGTTDTSVSKTLSGLLPNTTYHYRVVGQSAGGTTPGADMTFTTGKAAPSATTEAASAISTNGATLNGTVNASNDSTTVTFEYGLDTSYGTTVTADQSPISGATDTAVSKTISGLLPNQTYHYRVTAQNSLDSAIGADMTFTTASDQNSNTFQSQRLYDGWVREKDQSSEVGGRIEPFTKFFRLGDDAENRQYRAILSFDTSDIPDNAVITKVTLKIRKAGKVGANPFLTHGSLLVDIRNGSFDTSPSLQKSDFQAHASRYWVGAFKKIPGSNWHRANLAKTAYLDINKTGVTQFRLYFSRGDNNNFIADYLKFYSGEAGGDLAPQLIVEYEVP